MAAKKTVTAGGRPAIRQTASGGALANGINALAGLIGQLPGVQAAAVTTMGDAELYELYLRDGKRNTAVRDEFAKRVDGRVPVKAGKVDQGVLLEYMGYLRDLGRSYVGNEFGGHKLVGLDVAFAGSPTTVNCDPFDGAKLTSGGLSPASGRRFNPADFEAGVKIAYLVLWLPSQEGCDFDPKNRAHAKRVMGAALANKSSDPYIAKGLEAYADDVATDDQSGLIAAAKVLIRTGERHSLPFGQQGR